MNPIPLSQMPIAFKYKDQKGNITSRNVLPRIIFFGVSDNYTEPQLLLQCLDLDNNELGIFAIQNIVQDELKEEPLHLELGDAVIFKPMVKSERQMEGIVCFIDNDRIFFFSGSMPGEFYGTLNAKIPGVNITYNNILYNWNLMCQPRKRLAKISKKFVSS